MVFNGLIGAGIFALPSAVARETGSFSPFMFIVGGLLIATVVLSFGQAASYFRGTGGPVLYAGSAFGPFAGFQTGWLLYLGRVTALGANSNAMVNYGGTLIEDMASGLGRIVALSLIFFLLLFVNIRSVRNGIGATNVLTFLKLAPILLFIGIGLFFTGNDQLFKIELPDMSHFSAGLLVLIYAFVGFEGAVVPAGESRNPRRDIPKALLQTLLFTTVLYVLIQYICISVLPDLSMTKIPLADVANIVVGTPGVIVMSLAAFLSIAGNLSAITLAAPRMTYAMAREGNLPNWFAHINERFKTPVNSIIFMGVLGYFLAISGTFIWLAIMSSLTRMAGYAVCIAALPGLKKKFVNPDSFLKLPGGWTIPAIGFAVCIWLASQANLDAWLMMLGFVVVGTVFFYMSRRNLLS